MIKVKYDRGELNIDILTFTKNATMKDIKFLVDKFVKIADDRETVAAEMIGVLKPCLVELRKEYKELLTAFNDGRIAKYKLIETRRKGIHVKRMIELLENYI